MSQVIQNKLDSLSKSKFRSSFHLKQKEIEYINKKGLEEIKKQAYEIINKRIKPKIIENDGKQTPMKNHPVFIGQHATATCCRGCIEKWHHIKKNKELSAAMEVPALPPIEANTETKYRKIYLISARSTYDNKISFFWTTAFSKKEADRQINKHNGWLTSRDYMGLKKEPYYQLSTAKVVYEFENKQEYEDFLADNPMIENRIVGKWD